MRTLYAKIQETDQYDAYSEILLEILSQESLSDDDYNEILLIEYLLNQWEKKVAKRQRKMNRLEF